MWEQAHLCLCESFWGKMCCLSVHVDTSDSISVCLCSWLCFVSVLCVCVCVTALGIKPYLFREQVCLANTSWLPCSWQTDRQPQFVYCFRTVEIVGTWKRFGPAYVWFMRCVCLISIINDNTAKGRKTHLLPKLFTLMSGLKRTLRYRDLSCIALPDFSCVRQNGKTLQGFAQ